MIQLPNDANRQPVPRPRPKGVHLARIDVDAGQLPFFGDQDKNTLNRNRIALLETLDRRHLQVVPDDSVFNLAAIDHDASIRAALLGEGIGLGRVGDNSGEKNLWHSDLTKWS